jgi:hypothetical protein
MEKPFFFFFRHLWKPGSGPRKEIVMDSPMGSLTLSYELPPDSNLIYRASFIFPNKLKVGKGKKDGTTYEALESFKGKKAWEIFYEHATLEDVLRGQYGKDDEDLDTKSFEENLLCLPLKDFLEHIGKNPFALQFDRVKGRFMAVLFRAGRPDNAVKSMLRKHLVPKHPGGEKAHTGSPAKRELIVRMCRHFSKVCKDFLKEQDLWTDQKSALSFEWEENYWKLLGGLRDERIRLNPSDLHELISHPSNYAFQILKPFYRNLSQRSFYRR